MKREEKLYYSMLKDAPEVLTVLEAARLLRVGKNKAYALVKEGRLKSLKLGGSILVPKVRLVEFLLSESEQTENLFTSAVGRDKIMYTDGEENT